jgi:thiol-disulfide isomerase/thioredoxin
MKFGAGAKAVMPPQFSRSSDEIFDWMQKTSTSIPIKVDADALEALVKKEPLVFIACFKRGMPQVDDFTSAALSAGIEATFVWSTTGVCSDIVGVDQVSLVCEAKGEDAVIISRDFSDTKALIKVIQASAMPHVVEMMQGSTVTLQALDMYGADRLRLFLFADPNDSEYAKMKQAFVAASKASKEELGSARPLFAIVSSERKALMFKFKITSTPTLFGVEEGRSYQKCAGDLTSTAAITAYAALVAAPDSQASKSDEPAWDDNEYITRVTARDFEAKVLNGGKPVFMYIMLPTCMTCKAYAARVLQLAKAAAKYIPDIQFVKFDASTNDFEHPAMKEYENAYPNFILFKPGQSQGIPFPHEMVGAKVIASVLSCFLRVYVTTGLCQVGEIRPIHA